MPTLTWTFGAALFLSAALLFFVEPMFAKMVLPLLGGSPAVWNTCVVFFQATMLAGYAYAHLTTKHLLLTRQAGLHVALILAAGLVLPIAIPDGWAPPVDSTPIPALMLLLVVALGAPFFVVSSTAPLLQRWFSHTSHPSARDPYFLYAASNLGSIVALLGYPFVVEPRWPLSDQSAGWSGAYLLFGALTGVCAFAAVRPRAPRAIQTGVVGPPPDALTWRRRARWVALAAVPSSLMLGVTTFLSTDVAAMPLLWTIPLALYLLTFVIAFSTRRIVPRPVGLGAMTVLVLPLVMLSTFGLAEPVWLLIPLHLVGFLACALVLHDELARDRPATNYLTEFYLWIAFGGLVGGMFNTLVAPLVFTSVAEYPLGFVAAAALRPRIRRRRSAARAGLTAADVALPLALGGVATALLWGLRSDLIGSTAASALIGLIAVLYLACAERPARLGLGLGLALGGTMVFGPQGLDRLHAERTFFGVLRVAAEEDSSVHKLFHGSTLHGEQDIDPSRRSEPRTYYHPTGPVGQAFETLGARFSEVAVVGLGAGSLAAYARPGQQWTFYEIDPAVERIARSREYFTYLADCGGRCRVVLGDARLSLAAAEGARYDAIVLDAFSSDAIPIHLLTEQALGLYLSRLAASGIIAVHVSNRHLDLSPVVGALAARAGLSSLERFHESESQPAVSSSRWILLARSSETFGALATDARWEPVPTVASRVWTDDYSDILSALKWTTIVAR
jgi:spermidine synthase